MNTCPRCQWDINPITHICPWCCRRAVDEDRIHRIEKERGCLCLSAWKFRFWLYVADFVLTRFSQAREELRFHGRYLDLLENAPEVIDEETGMVEIAGMRELRQEYGR